MIKKIRDSLSVKIFLGILTILVVVSLIIYGSLRVLMPKALQNEQGRRFTNSLQTLVSKLEVTPIDEINPLITEFSIDNQSSITVMDSNNNEVTNVNYARDNSSKYGNAISSTVSFENDGRLYIILAEFPGYAVDQLSDTFARIFPFVLVLILIISILVAAFYSRLVAKPIVKISDISKRMTSLDMTWSCDVDRSDEIGVLAVNLNTMSEKLSTTLDRLKSANQKLQEDIVREKKQEKIKVDFFRAVSHELKTPITILKGELEGMIYGVGEYKDKDTYLRHSMKTVIEIENLVKEILSASRMAADDLPLSASLVNLSSLIQTVCLKLQGIAEDKNINLVIDTKPLVYLGDEALLQKAFSSIIGNAITHSPNGETVTVTLSDRLLQVENMGIHIKPEDMEHIYQPFYRVDKSRNSSSGGNGLGLYIVKTVLDRHGLNYKLENTTLGVRFSVLFN